MWARGGENADALTGGGLVGSCDHDCSHGHVIIDIGMVIHCSYSCTHTHAHFMFILIHSYLSIILILIYS